jgi:hypothetical protein
MSEGVQQNLRLALRMMLKPLVKLLINQGVTHADFADAAKEVYVEMAIRYFMEGERINQSRVAVLTGLTRKEVKNVIARAATSESHGKAFSRPSRVLLGWHSDPVYTGPYGVPLELPYDSVEENSPSFKTLVRTYGSDMAAKQMLDVLLGTGAVVELENGSFRVVRRQFEPERLSPQLLERFGDVAHNFFSTAAKNIEKKSQGGGIFERVVHANRPLSPEATTKFDAFIKERGQRFLEEVDNWIVMLEDDGTESESQLTGLGMYHFIESKQDKSSFRQLLAERGVEAEEDESN